MKRQVIDNTQGGLNLRDSELLKDNQFEELKNFYYDKDGRLRTRKGITPYFEVVPDTVVNISDCENTTGWVVSDDGANLTTGSAIRGSASVSFDISVAGSANDDAILSNSSISADISNAKNYLTFWVHVPTGFNTNLTDVKVRLGTDSSNYYEWTLGTLTENADNFIRLVFDNAATIGTVNDASIAYFSIIISYNSSYTDKTGILVDSINCYSSTYTEPIQGFFSVKDYANDEQITICVAGENMFLLTSNTWEVIDTGLTKFETATGKTDHRTRWGFFAYNGSGTLEIGMGNGIDNYRKWDGTKITEFSTQPKCKYFVVLNDRIFSAGDPNAPITLYYTNAAVANVNILNTNDVDVGTEQSGKINGLFPLGEILLAGKDNKIFYIDVDAPLAKAIDAQDGMFSHRATANVENAVLLLSKRGISNLRQKDGTTGGQAIVGKGYSDDLQDKFKLIEDNVRNSNCGIYNKKLHNYYISFDTGNDDKPDTTFVYSALVGAWSEYVYPSFYQYAEYIDSDNNVIPLACSANAGLIYQIETGYDDDGANIEYKFKTKKFNMKNPASWKDWHSVDIIGYKNKGSSIDLEVYANDSIIYSATLDDTFIDESAGSVILIGEEPISEDAVGGGATDTTASEIEVYRYRIRLGGSIFGAGQTIQIKGTGNDNPTVFTLDRYEIIYDDNSIDIIPFNNFA